MNNEGFCQTVLKIDPKIRYVGVYLKGNLHSEMQSGLESYMTRKETEQSLSFAVIRWKSRKKLQHKTGKPLCAMAKYEKMYRITIPLKNDGLILVSTEADADVIKIVNEIEVIKNQYKNSE